MTWIQIGDKHLVKDDHIQRIELKIFCNQQDYLIQYFSNQGLICEQTFKTKEDAQREFHRMRAFLSQPGLPSIPLS